MELKLPTFQVKSRKVHVDVPNPDLKLRDRASDLAGAAAGQASGIAGAAASAAAGLRDYAADRAADLRDRAADMSLPDLKLGDVPRPNLDLSNVDLPDLGRAVAAAPKAVEDGISVVADSFRSIGKGIEGWRKPKKQEPPVAEAGIALLAGMGGGMALMYFLDPAQGRQRRSMLVARLGAWWRMAAASLQGGSHDMANRSQGMKAGLTSMGRSTSPAAEMHVDVAASPDASRELAATDSAAMTASAVTGMGSVAEPGYGSASSAWPEETGSFADTNAGAGASPEVYGEAWGEATPEDQRDRIRMGSEG